MVIHSSQGTKFSVHDILLYDSLGSLLQNYRKWRNISQEKLAEVIGIGVRELRNWEAGHRRANTENLHDIAEATGIPMQVCVALNVNQPIWYSLHKRMFMYSSIEESQFSSHELFTQYNNYKKDNFINYAPITKHKQIDTILSCHKDLYGSEKLLHPDLIKASAIILPDHNMIFYDSWGHYVGHQVTLPIRMEVYQDLKKQKTIEDYIKRETIVDIIALGGGVFFSYSTFAVNISVSAAMISFGLQALNKTKHKERYLIASHTVTKESTIVKDTMGMRLAHKYTHLNNATSSVIHEIELAFFMRPDGPLGCMTEQICEEALNYSEKTISGDKFSLTVGKPSLIVGKNSPANQNGKRPVHEACANAECLLYGKTEKGNIISNGTYTKKDGTTGRRFQCKECGKSFCSRTGTIFYDLRSPEEKVFQAFKLLVKGVNLQEVANLLRIKLVTVRHWLDVAARQREKIDAILINELDISRTELDMFWTSVKTKFLHQRATLKIGHLSDLSQCRSSLLTSSVISSSSAFFKTRANCQDK